MPERRYSAPNVIKVYNDDEAIHKIIQLVNESTDSEICDTFSHGIDENDYVKRCMDVADLTAIRKDIDRFNKSSNILPKLSGYTTMIAMIDMFINITEEKVGKRLNYYDFFDIPGICEDVNIIKPTQEYRNNITKYQKFRDIGFNNIITSIRNGFMHNRYVIKRDGVYIHSKNAWQKKTNERDADGNCIVEQQDFEAIISFNFFEKIIKFCTETDRKLKTSGFAIDNINREKGFEENKDVIERSSHESERKGDIYASVADAVLSINSENGKIKKLSKGQKEFLSEYFKNHEFNRKNLEFVNKFMVYDDNRLQINAISQLSPSILDQRNYFLYLGESGSISRLMMEWFTEGDNVDGRRIWGSDEYIEKEVRRKFSRIKAKPTDIFSIYHNKEAERYLSSSERRVLDEILPPENKDSCISLIKDIKYELLVTKDLMSTITDYRKNYLKTLYLSKFYINNPKLELAQPQKRVGIELWQQGRDYIINKCKRNSKSYWSKEAKEGHMDEILGDSYRDVIFKDLTRGNSEDLWIITRDNDEIEEYINDNRDYLMFNTPNANELSIEQKQIVEDNVRRVIKDWKEKLDTVTLIGEEEHIRNAFAHHNYTILPGFNKILLWDPSMDDTPNREKIYDLDALYQNCVGRENEDYLDIKKAA